MIHVGTPSTTRIRGISRPSAIEIQRQCAEIQQKWSAEERQFRRFVAANRLHELLQSVGQITTPVPVKAAG